MHRRQFLHASGAVLTLAALNAPLSPTVSGAGPRSLKKGIMFGTVGIKGSLREQFKAVKAAGYDGVEANSHMDQDEVVKAAEAAGLEIPSVCCSTHWDSLVTDPDPAVREKGVAGLKQTLRDAQRYGAKSVLFVPGRVTKQVSYAQAYDRSQAEIRKAIPLAAELKVKIAIENVWNDFLLSPLEAARFVDDFSSPWVGWHFDVGNVLNYGYPEHWIRTLGKRIAQVHIKEFSRKNRNDLGLWKGFEIKLLEGDNDWPAVMKAFDDIGYRGWGISEQGGGDSPEGLRDLVQRMDRIFAS